MRRFAVAASAAAAAFAGQAQTASETEPAAPILDETAQQVLRWSDAVRKPLGMDMEIVPQADPVPRAGDKLRVQVL